ncbi:hypothetical protein A1359_20320 [Methylomonas lenta]|uniref:Peptidase S8/S53 domain-containing protein n=1 Tax=Methylomonas lenta TaxID=980561 RepID=A0A177NS80_9GAMM|nr:S8 family serine peptidase [Methylomonas lenta]OAI20835.1 hypothetical protein A1359_20320 [Methylomonas lenta]
MESLYMFPEPNSPQLLAPGLFAPFDIQIDQLIGAPLARESFKVDGQGQCVAILDTGLRVTHQCFRGRVVEAHNFLDNDNGTSLDVTDNNGHGTNVAGIIAGASGDERSGIAPGANIVPLKVIPSRDVNAIFNALLWVYENTDRLNISAVNFSFGIPNVNLTSDVSAENDYPELMEVINMLVSKRVAVIASSGNDYYSFQTEGMSIPAIFRQVISVGSVYDSNIGSRSYKNGASARSTHSDQVAPYSQRLSKDTGTNCHTVIFGPGGLATAAGAADDNATSIQDGTSQAAPTITGVILLLQQYYSRLKGVRPPISVIRNALLATSAWITDGDDEDDNVAHTGRRFQRVNAYESLLALHRAIQLGNAD